MYFLFGLYNTTRSSGVSCVQTKQSQVLNWNSLTPSKTWYSSCFRIRIERASTRKTWKKYILYPSSSNTIPQNHPTTFFSFFFFLLLLMWLSKEPVQHVCVPWLASLPWQGCTKGDKWTWAPPLILLIQVHTAREVLQLGSYSPRTLYFVSSQQNSATPEVTPEQSKRASCLPFLTAFLRSLWKRSLHENFPFPPSDPKWLVICSSTFTTHREASMDLINDNEASGCRNKGE